MTRVDQRDPAAVWLRDYLTASHPRRSAGQAVNGDDPAISEGRTLILVFNVNE